jgi:pheromone a factor receptor
MSASQGLSRSRYIRLMAIGAIEVLCTIPLGTFIIVYNAGNGVTPWVSWADTHSNYSQVEQVASFIWRNDPHMEIGLELFRWSLVVCSLVFFALFGFADEARNCYRRVFTTLASRIGYSTFTLHGSSHACVVHVILFKLIGTDFFFAVLRQPLT